MTRLFFTASLLALAAAPAFAKDQIQIVGSGTVYPFTTTVAEAFGKATGKKTPVVEANGTGGGIKLFCSGDGDDTPDFVNASRAMKKDEFAACEKNGVKDIAQLVIGWDGIALANAKGGPAMTITKQQLFQALAKQVPDKDGKLVDNPYKTWSDIDASLPAVEIRVLSHPATSGTRASIEDQILKPGAKAFKPLAELEKSDAKAFDAVFKTMRTDGAFVEAGENDNAIVQKLQADANSFALFGFANVELNGATVQAASVDGTVPTMENVSSGEYKVSRPLYVYVKKSHMAANPDMAGFIKEYMSEKAIGAEGYLADKGLVPLTEAQFEKEAANAKDLPSLTADQLK